MASLIRMRWTEQEGEFAGPWFPDTNRNRAALKSAVAFGNRIYGADTHSIETMAQDEPVAQDARKE